MPHAFAGLDPALDYETAAAPELAFAAIRTGATPVTAGLQHPGSRMQLPTLQRVAQKHTLAGS